MSYSIRIERNETGQPVITRHSGQLPGTVVITGTEDHLIQTISAGRVDAEEHQVLSAMAQRLPEPGPLE